MLSRLAELDEQLATRGFPRISPWWWSELRRFYLSGRRRYVGRIGRRGGKSTTWTKVLVAELLYGDHRVPPGDVGIALIAAVKKPVAKKRLSNVKKILTALGVEFQPWEDDGVLIPIVGRAVQAVAASFRTAVGDTAFFLLLDEVARWRDEETGENPATEVLRTLRPSLATMPMGREVMLSSPWSTLDAHAEAFDQGDDDVQMVAQAPTWVANPTLTEAQCRAEEADEETFWREYGARPMRAGASTFLDAGAVDEAVRRGAVEDLLSLPGDQLAAGGDFAFARNSSALAIVRARPLRLASGATAGMIRCALALRVVKPGDRPLKPSEVVGGFADELAAYGVRGLMADAHYRESIVEHLAARQLSFIRAPLEPSESYVRFRAELHEGRLLLPRVAGPDCVDRLVRDLKEVRSRPTPNGRVVIDLPHRRDGSHADLVSALVLACWQRAGTDVEDAREAGEFAGWSAEDREEFEESLADHRRGLGLDDAGDDTGFGGADFLLGDGP